MGVWRVSDIITPLPEKFFCKLLLEVAITMMTSEGWLCASTRVSVSNEQRRVTFCKTR
jgi:hypothetical protein